MSSSTLLPEQAADGPELVFGLVGAVGVNLHEVTSALGDALRLVNYQNHVISISSLIRSFGGLDSLPPQGSIPKDEYIQRYQDRGDYVRRKSRDGGLLAKAAIGQIVARRGGEASFDPEPVASAADAANRQGALELAAVSGFVPARPLYNTAFIVRSLKHPREAQVLRDVYGSRCVIVAAHRPKDEAIRTLAREIARSLDEEQVDGHGHRAQDVYEREADPDRDVPEEELERRVKLDDRRNEFGQNVRDTYQLADYFVDATTSESTRTGIERLTRLVFGAPFETPTADEMAMSVAAAVSLRSSAMGRQVGAAVVGERGEILAVGANEVPRAGGGQYWPGDPVDGRDFSYEDHTDSSVIVRRAMINEMLGLLVQDGVIPALPEGTKVEDLLRALRTARLSKLVEFGRPVHAEMSAISDAARQGIALRGAKLVCTTYPCHSCARHIVAAGIAEVVYIEPYAKSLAQNLHSDAIVRDRRSSGDGRVLFRQFLGAAPRMYHRVFAREKNERRDGAGVALTFIPSTAQPRVDEGDFVYQLSEVAALATFQETVNRQFPATQGIDTK